MTGPSTPTAEGVRVRIDSGDGRPDVVWLENSVLRLGIVPDLGGRLLSARAHGREMLWRNTALLDDRLHPVAPHVPGPVSGPMSGWHNYGGDKTWLAPQGWDGAHQWAGPPDPVLDSGRYRWTVERTAGAVSLTATSGHDPRSGMTLSRTVTLTDGTCGYDLRVRGRNTSTEPVRWALWNVVQRPGGHAGSGGVEIGVDAGATQAVPLAVGTAAPTVETIDDARVRVPHQDVVGKVGFPGASGWLEHTVDGVVTRQTFAVDPEGDYPDGGSRVEVWMEHPLDGPLPHLGDLWPTARIVEIEVLGPSVALAPGEHSTLQVTTTFDQADGGSR